MLPILDIVTNTYIPKKCNINAHLLTELFNRLRNLRAEKERPLKLEYLGKCSGPGAVRIGN